MYTLCTDEAVPAAVETVGTEQLMCEDCHSGSAALLLKGRDMSLNDLS